MSIDKQGKYAIKLALKMAEHRLTQRGLSERAGVCKQTVTNVLNGRRYSFASAAKIAFVFNEEPSSLDLA